MFQTHALPLKECAHHRHISKRGPDRSFINCHLFKQKKFWRHFNCNLDKHVHKQLVQVTVRV